MLWVTDPKDKNKSVSLTLMMVSFALWLGTTAVGFIMQLRGKPVWDTSMVTQLFYVTTALYFGRRLSTKAGKVVGVEDKDDTNPDPPPST